MAPPSTDTRVEVHRHSSYSVLSLVSEDVTNRLTRACVLALTEFIANLESEGCPLILVGNRHFFSAGADLSEIRSLEGPSAYEFARLGQRLMRTIELFPAPVYAAIEGYCMGGGLDLASPVTAALPPRTPSSDIVAQH